MNGELKTLKDVLEENGIDFEEGDWGDIVVEMRQQAIKWIKAIKLRHGEFLINMWKAEGRDDEFINMELKPTLDFNAGQVNILKYLFNITEEDLK